MIPQLESAVLGSCMVDPSAFWRIADVTRQDHFTTAQSVALWRAISIAAKSGAPYDVVTMAESTGDLYRFALEVANTDGYRAANVRAYADRLADAYTARAVHQAGSRIAMLEGSGSERLEAAQGIVREISTSAATVRTARDVLGTVHAEMQRQCDENRAVFGLATGFGHLDRMTGGLEPGDLVIIAGRPSMGKSILAMQIAMNVALRGEGVHLATLEMNASSALKRMIASDGRIPFQHVRNASLLEDDEWTRLTGATGRLAAAPLTMDDSEFRCDAICARIRQQAMSRGIALAVVDYLGYMQLPSADRHDLRVQEATRGMKRVAKELQIPVILVAQLNRKADGDRPKLSDLRDAGAIEQDADLVLFVHREDYYKPEHHTAGFAELIVAKQRNGPTGSLALKSSLHFVRFDEAEGMPSEPEADPATATGFAGRYRRTRGAPTGGNRNAA